MEVDLIARAATIKLEDLKKYKILKKLWHLKLIINKLNNI